MSDDKFRVADNTFTIVHAGDPFSRLRLSGESS